MSISTISTDLHVSEKIVIWLTVLKKFKILSVAKRNYIRWHDDWKLVCLKFGGSWKICIVLLLLATRIATWRS